MKINGEYNKSSNYTSNFSNGVVGGFRTSNELYINFYNESVTLPTAFEVNVDEVNHKVEENGVRKTQITRTITSQIVLNREAAVRLRDWLSANLDKTTQGGANGSTADNTTVDITGLLN